MSTIKDVAERAQVSICTVSRYLNNNMGVKKATEEKINAAIRDLKYIPNKVAKSLKNNRTKNIAVIVPKINNLYYSEITAGISNVLEQYNYNLFIYEVESSYKKKETEILQTMIENMMAGVIFIGLSYDMSFKLNLKILLDYNVPIVFVNRSISYEGYPLVYPDYVMAGELAAEHLLKKGRKNIAVVNKTFENIELYQQVTSFIKKVKEYDICIDKNNMIETHSSFNFSEDVINTILSKNIDGIFAVNELLAVGLIKSLIQKKVKIPDDIAVIGFGNTLLGELVTPELTSVDLQNYNIGIKSAEVLLSQVLERNYDNINILKPVIVERNST
jgi:DNA-binding LacI/PurR family transcriptional regulator